MALTYKNQITGRAVTVLEPDELGEKLETVKHRGKPMDPKLIHLAKKRREKTIKKMNDSWKWARTGASSQESGAAAASAGSDLSKLKKADLEQIAAARGVDLSEAKTNADRVAAIEAAGGAVAAGDDAGTGGEE